MNETVLRTFIESRHRKLTVAIVTTVVALLVLVPLVDDTIEKSKTRGVLAQEVISARETNESLPKFEQRVKQVVNEVAKLETRTVTEESVSRARSDLVGLIRESGCQMRRLEVSAPQSRPWVENDDPLVMKAPLGVSKNKTPFTLERRTIHMSVAGEMASIHNLLDELEKDKAVSYPHRLQLQSTENRKSVAAMDLEMWYFALKR